MQTIDDFLKQDIVQFLDVLDKNLEENVASIDETNELLKQNFNDKSSSNLGSSSNNVISPSTKIETVNVYQTIKQESNPFISTNNDSNSKNIDLDAVKNIKTHSNKISNPKLTKKLHLKSTSVSESNPTKINKSSKQDFFKHNSFADSSNKDSSKKFVSKEDISNNVDDTSSKIENTDAIKSSSIKEESTSVVSNKQLESSLELTKDEYDSFSKEEEFNIYVKAIIALHKKDLVTSIKHLSFLLSKHPHNVALKLRLQDAFLLKDKLDNKIIKQARKKVVSKKNHSKKSKLNNSSSEIQLSSVQFDKYVEALKELKNKNKESALKLLKELVKENPKNFSIKLRLKEAMEL